MKISKNTSRLFALLMAVVMLVGMLPVSAFAAEETVEYVEASTLENGKTYVIVEDGYAMTSEAHNGYRNTNGYVYTGLVGAAFNVNSITDDMYWKVTVNSGVATIQHEKSGKYLAGSLASNSHGGYTADLTLSSDANTALKWTINGDDVKCNDFDGIRSGKTYYLVFDNKPDQIEAAGRGDGQGSGNLFGFRTTSDNLTFYEVKVTTGGNQGGQTPSTQVIEITTNNTASSATEDVSIAVGESFTLKLTNGSGSSKTHAISNTDSSVASVDASNNFSISGNGTKEITITGLKNGKTTITFTGTSSGGSTYYAVVNVTVGTGAGGNQGGGTTETETVEITATSSTGGATGSAEIEVGQTLVIKLTNGSSNNTKNYTTEVANEQVASVVSGAELSLSKSATGEITVLGVSAGTTTIVSTSDVGSGSNTYKATINLTVTGEGTVAPPAGGEDDDEIAKTADIHLAFTSDIHNNGSATTNGTGANNLTKWLEAVAKKNNDTFDTMGFTGDHGDRGQNGSNYWSRVQTVMDVVSGSDYVDATEGFFVDGNHEYQNGSQNRDHTNSNATSKKIKKIGEKLVADDYVLYSFGAASGNQAFDSNDITALDNYLKTVDGQKPVFVLSHFPIHYYNSRTTNNAQALVNVLNNYPNVIFLWGHNHTLSDSYYDEVYAAGSELPLTSSSSSKVKINFTYAGAGCMADSSTAAGVQADGLVAKVDGNKVTLTYYNVNANVVGQSTTITIEEKEEHSHTYGNPAVTWADNNETATVTVTCDVCAAGTDGKTVSATVNATVTTTPGDCVTKATTTYAIPAGTIGDKNYPAAEKTVEGAFGDHAHGTAWKSNDDKHWHECSKCGDQKDAADHTPGAAATETDPQLCTVCEYVITPATGHVNHDFSVAVEGGVTPATCTQTGTEVKKCSGCELTETTTLPIDTDAHSWNAGVITTPATCTTAGVKTFTCQHNNTHTKTEAVAIDEDAHNFVEGECEYCDEADPDYVPEPAGNPTKVTSLVAGKYVIASGSKALTSAVNSGYTNSYNYAYSGFNGANVTISGNEITGGATQDMEFELAASGNGFTIKHVASGKYLNATYTKNSGNDGWTGVLTLSNTQDVWTWDASTGYLKSANASNNSDNKSMYFTFDDRENNGATGNFFGIRSGGSSNNYDNVDKIDFYLIGAPLDDDNQGGNPGGGNQGGGNQGGTEVPEQPTKVTTLKAGQYVLVSNDNKKALTTTTHNGYTNTNNYSYSGFNGADVTISGNVITNGATQDMVFEVAVVSGGYTIKNVAKNQYLTASYGSNSSGAYTGALTLSATAETWEWDSSNGRLKSTKASNNDRGLGVYLTFDDKPDTVSSGSGNFFGVRTEGSNHDYANVDHIDFYLVGEALDDGQGGNPGGGNQGGGNAGNGNGSTVYVAFSSDVHSKTTNANESGQSPYRLNQWLTNVGNNIGQKFEDMVFCGDNADGTGASNGDDFWAKVQTVMDVAKNNTNLKTEGKFLAGNHEYENGSLATTTNATAKKIQSVGTKVVTDNYVLYLFGATSSDQKNTGFKTADITALDNYLSTAPTDRPIFITSHFPIHTYSSRSTANASTLIDTLNKYGDKLDLYFIWGHNHSQSDNNYDKFFDDDDQLLSKDINFVYCAAGAMSDSEYQGSGNVKGKGLVAKIVSGKVESLSYYGTSYTVTSSYKPTYTGGTVTPDQPDQPDHDHIWDEGTVTTQPTCYAVGVKTYKCTACDATKTEDIAMVAHDAKTTWTSDTTSHWHDCNNCTAQIDLAEHTWDEGTVITEATDTKPGTMEYTCTVCAQTKLEDIAALDHDLASVWSSDETYHWVECNTCDELVNKAEHTWNEGTVTTAPTCTATGVKTLTCTVCALTKTEEIAATGHTYTEWTKVDDSTHESACACGEKTTAEHTWDEGVISIAATCGTAGEKTYTCSVCTGTKAEVIPATGEHVFEDEKCTVCGANEEDIVLVAPEILSCYSKVQTAVKVTWTLVDHADGYELWRTSTPDDADSWVRAKTIKDGSKDRYTNQDLDKGVTYYYKVRAYMEDANGNKTYSAFSDVDYMPATVVWDGPYSNATFRIRLRWNEIGGAHGYQIWRLNEDGETWSVVKTLGDRNNILTDNQGATTAYSNTGLEAGKQYTYKMRAFMIPEEGRKVFGAYSDEFTIAVMPETPEITVTSPKATRAQIEWDEINGAAGYQVWMQNPESDAGWAIVKSVTDGNTAYTKYDLKSGTTYEFKVRAYTEVNGKKTFGAYSEVISIKVK